MKLAHCLAVRDKVQSAASILVADDEKNTREALEAILKGEDYHVTAAEDGKKALSLAKTQHFDLIITDLEMPGMNGLVLLRTLKERGITTTVIVISAYRKSEAYRSVEEEDVHAFIDKPFRKADILRIVKRALSESSRQESVSK